MVTSNLTSKFLFFSRSTPRCVIDPTHARKLLLGLLMLALVVRVAVMLLLKTWIFPNERAFGFEAGEIGYALANGQGFSWPQTWRSVGPLALSAKRDHPEPTAWEAPIYPLIIGATFRCLGSYTARAAIALELFQISLSLFACCVLFRLGKQLFNERVGLLAAFIFAFYPSAIYFSLEKIGYVTLLVLLALLLIQQTIQLSIQPSVARSLALGGLSGVASLVNPVILAFYPFVLLWFVWRCQSSWLTRLKYAATIVLCCCATVTPWLIRNYLVFNRFVFLKPNFTLELVHANFTEYKDLSASGRRIGITSGEGRMSAFYNQHALSLVLKHPGRLLRQTANRALNYWFKMDTPRPRDKVVGIASYYPVLFLGLLGIWAARRDRHAQLLIAFVLTMPLPFYLTWAVMARYRFPIEPILILFASYTVTSWVYKTPQSSSRLALKTEECLTQPVRDLDVSLSEQRCARIEDHKERQWAGGKPESVHRNGSPWR